MRNSALLRAALAAAGRGWSVFPLIPGGKTPAVRGWEDRATTDPGRIRRHWAAGASNNIGIATGRSGLVVIDLDDGDDCPPPETFAGARHGRDVLVMLAARAGAEVPTDTYTVATPAGLHLYFRAPDGLELRNTTAKLGWRIDTRAHGGYVVAAGSLLRKGKYRVVRAAPVAELPGWLATALTPPPLPESGPPLHLSGPRATAYLRAILDDEARAVASAHVGTRHMTLLKAARALGRLVGGQELAVQDARHALMIASAGHIGTEDYTAAEVLRTIDDGIAYGRQLPRRISNL
ncbi:bifunctional DNA primase/polymerase [Nocardia amamiensis]|uniref:bifunctional DNA primase/polymerase n=1 Tax=Nocardia amamiensis TaxID=404578 RepID=UPI0008352E6C|nr:bifunctional DNA primase/polymerase [Nocardia amamiensis]